MKSAAMKAMRRIVIASLLLLFATGADAQPRIVLQYVFSPTSPRAGDTVSVFIRATDPTNGYVLCPETAQIITRVQVNGNLIVLDLSNFAFPGGLVRPYCDGNTAQLGALAAGTYSVTARVVYTNGVVLGTLLTSPLVVGPALVPVAVPLWDVRWLLACVIGVAIAGARFARKRI